MYFVIILLDSPSPWGKKKCVESAGGYFVMSLNSRKTHTLLSIKEWEWRKAPIYIALNAIPPLLCHPFLLLYHPQPHDNIQGKDNTQPQGSRDFQVP